jgi:hypothetical protein
MINKDFTLYEEALELKQLGFKEHCLKYENSNERQLYSHEISWFELDNQDVTDFIELPTYSQAFRWFREKHNLFGCIDLQSCEPAHWYIRIDNIIANDYLYHSEDENIQFETYEEAELACLKKLIKLKKNG